jgi:hypothetical protein
MRGGPRKGSQRIRRQRLEKCFRLPEAARAKTAETFLELL